ncbi:hypothetical protein BDR26DRAFT_925189 [Obelidium mucronatum]|nr:hypothetical protein BDR26DRAFT_925189 [Obelidium mucronatum]
MTQPQSCNPADWVESYYRISSLEFSILNLEKETEALETRRKLRHLLGKNNNNNNNNKATSNLESPKTPAYNTHEAFGSSDMELSRVDDIIPLTAGPFTSIITPPNSVEKCNNPVKEGFCLLYQESETGCKWSAETCSHPHKCVLCNGPHSLKNCVKFTSCFWRKKYCLVWQRDKFRCHRSCKNIHKCIKCDSEEHGASSCTSVGW